MFVRFIPIISGLSKKQRMTLSDRGHFQNRRKFNCLLAFVLIIGLVLTSAYIISAQQDSGRRQQRPGQRQQRRQIDPEVMIQRRIERIMRDLNLSEEETAVLKPKIASILHTRLEQNREARNLIDALRKAIEAKDDEQIQAKLTEVKNQRKENQAKIETMEQELIELLTLKQEAQLTVSGVINSDGIGGFFGGFRRQQRPGRGQQ
jgi:chromosome segregation ATPase